MSRRTFINLVFFNVVFVVMLVWAFNNIVSWDRIEQPYTITGDFAQASGVQANAEVTYLGVHYGRVSSVERLDQGVRMTMKIDKGKELPAGAVARVFRKSAIGEPYVDFVPPADFAEADEAVIEEGENVPLERTTVPLEFSELLRSASALISSIEPDTAGRLVHELSLALEGRGEALRSLTTSFDEITSSFVTRTEQLDRLADNSTRLTKVFADHRLSLGRSLQNLRDVSQTLRDADGDTRRLLEAGPDFLGITADLVADQKRNIDCLLSDLGTVVSTLGQDEPLGDLLTTIRNGPTAFGLVARSVDHEPDGPWVRVNLILPVGEPDPPLYVPPRSLPTVPTVSGCDSNLTAAAGSQFTPSGPAALRSGPIAATGMQVASALALLMVGAALATWRLRAR